MPIVRAPLSRSTALVAALLASTIPASVNAAATGFETFTPAAQTNTSSIDYDVWNEAVQNIVISMGPSLRETPGRPPSGFGTRLVYGHTSRYRLEGSRVSFSFLDETIRSNLANFRQELQATAERVDLQSLSRNEQLAYWINLHNVALVEQIAKEWPVRQPRSIEIDGVPLDDAKFITVEGKAISLRDIREKIVYANWSNPLVIYGFWRGEIGGPSIQRRAYTGDNVRSLLNSNATEFVNSLRGTQKLGSKLQVSTFYEEVAPFYFPDFEADVRAHIAKYAQEDVADILAKTTKTEAAIKEYDIADLAGGSREPTFVAIQDALNNRVQSFRIPRAMGILLAQREEKFRRILKEGRTGTVTFSDVELPGEAGGENDIE